MNTRNCYDIIIIGGGASGLMLAANLNLRAISRDEFSSSSSSRLSEQYVEGRRRLRGLILEKTDKLGAKLLLSGGGHCNVTHAGSIKDFVNAYGESGRFLRKPLYRHSNIELCRFFEDAGIPLTDGAEDKGRIFPRSMRSSDILDALVTKSNENGWEIRTNTEVTGISLPKEISCESSLDNDTAQSKNSLITLEACSCSSGCEFVLAKEAFVARAVVVATGGKTLPNTGSDGKMLDILADLGVHIVPPRSALAPINVKDYPYGELSGISIPDVTVTVSLLAARREEGGAKIKTPVKPMKMTGDILFTHDNFSGPVILNISRYARSGETIRISYNKPLAELPRRLVKLLEHRSRGESGDIRTSILSGLLEHEDFVIESVAENGMVTAGGVSLSEIDSATMLIKRLPSSAYVYAIGEALDCDGITGGYNLQMCWSTAAVAADSLRAMLT